MFKVLVAIPVPMKVCLVLFNGPFDLSHLDRKAICQPSKHSASRRMGRHSSPVKAVDLTVEHNLLHSNHCSVGFYRLCLTAVTRSSLSSSSRWLCLCVSVVACGFLKLGAIFHPHLPLFILIATFSRRPFAFPDPPCLIYIRILVLQDSSKPPKSNRKAAAQKGLATKAANKLRAAGIKPPPPKTGAGQDSPSENDAAPLVRQVVPSLLDRPGTLLSGVFGRP